MDYTNRVCSVCGNAFGKDDDIVVCPECATPHHRECWLKNGFCVNADKHAEGFVWSASDNEPAKDPAQNERENIIPETDEASVKICHICGSENPADTLHCGNCGAFFGNEEKTTEVVNCAYCNTENDARAIRCKNCGAPVLKIFRSDNPYIYSTGMQPDEPVAGVTANEASLYTQSAAKFYLKKFKKIDSKKLTFNWAAFFFAPYWFFFRKLYKAGIAALLIFVSVSMLTVGLVSPAFEAYDEYIAVVNPIIEAVAERDSQLTAEEEKALVRAQEKFVEAALPTLLLSIFIMLGEKLICGLIADKLYYNKMREDLSVISEAVDDNGVKQIMILKRGKPSAVAFAAALLGEHLITNIFMTIANMI